MAEDGDRAWVTKGLEFCTKFRVHILRQKKEQSLWSQTVCIQILALLLESCVTWRTSLNFSVPQVPHLYSRANNSTYLIRFLSIQAVNLGKNVSTVPGT